MSAIACIVEGQGETDALPLLVRRVLAERLPSLRVLPPIRQSRSRLIETGGLERALQLARLKLGGAGAVLVVIDADDDCPAELAPALIARAQAVLPGFHVSIVFAKREFEAWFLAAAYSLRGVRGLAVDLQPPADPEGIRGAKEWLDRHKRDGYSPTIDQAKLAAKMDLEQARAAPSFDKLVRELARIGQLLNPSSDPA